MSNVPMLCSNISFSFPYVSLCCNLKEIVVTYQFLDVFIKKLFLVADLFFKSFHKNIVLYSPVSSLLPNEDVTGCGLQTIGLIY